MAAPRILNLTFHGLGDPGRRLEPGEEVVWMDVARFERVLDEATGRTDTRISFDDGNASDVRIALPALEQRGMRATFFVVAERLGQPGFVAGDDVQALAAAGMSIGSHGMRHRPWRGLSEAQLEEEVSGARERIRTVAGVEVDEAACPFGAYDRRVLRALRRAGYVHVYTSDGGPSHPRRWLQVRNTLGRSDDAGSVAALSRRRLLPGAVRTAKRTVKRWR